MTSADIDIAEILFGDKLKVERIKIREELQDEVRAEVRKEVQAEVRKEVQNEIWKEKQFKQLETLFNLMKQIPSLSNKEYAKIVDDFSVSKIDKTKEALKQMDKKTIKKAITTIIFKKVALNATDNRRLGRMITQYFK